MIYLLDTNACVNYLRSPGNSNITRKLLAGRTGDAVVCSIVKAELIYGAYRSRNADESLSAVQVFFASFPSLPFDDAAAEICGRIRSELGVTGVPPCSKALWYRVLR